MSEPAEGESKSLKSVAIIATVVGTSFLNVSELEVESYSKSLRSCCTSRSSLEH